MAGALCVISTDNIDGRSKDSARMESVATALQQAGYRTKIAGIGPNTHYTMTKYEEDTGFLICIYGGACAGTIYDQCQSYYTKKIKNNKLVMAFTHGAKDITNLNWLERAHDDNFSPSSFKGLSNPGQYLTQHGVLWFHSKGESDFAQEVVSVVKNGNVNGASGGSSVTLEDGFMESARGGGKTSSPQFWNAENFEPYEPINFSEFEITEEDYESKTATFKTDKRIDLTSGRVSVLICGDIQDFGGIILSRDYDPDTRIYTYTCQGWMDRIMANEIYAVHSGKYTVYSWIKKLLADMGIPDTGLEKIDNYDESVDKKVEEEVSSDNDDPYEKLGETSSNSDSSSSVPTASNPTGTVTSTSKGKSKSKKDSTKRNPFKKTPLGIYDKLTVSDYIRTLLFDYGVHVRFYGDINGIPHFEAYDVNTYANTGLILSSDMGIEEDYKYKFDITDIVTQVMIKNISAVSPTGEVYTSKDLFGVNLATYFGRMGTIKDNPTHGSTGSASGSSSGGDYKDAAGNTYSADKVIATNGMPSCSHGCLKQYGYKHVQKYWVNKCAGCGKEGVLKDNPKGVAEKELTCGNCDMDYCEVDGYEKISSSSKRLTEVFKSTTTSTTNDTTDTTSNSS